MGARLGPLAAPRDEWAPEALPTLVRRAGEETWHRVVAIDVPSGRLLVECVRARDLPADVRPHYVSRNEHPGAIYGDVPENVGEPRCAACERATMEER